MDYEIYEVLPTSFRFMGGFDKGDKSRFDSLPFNDELAIREFKSFCAHHGQDILTTQKHKRKFQLRIND